MRGRKRNEMFNAPGPGALKHAQTSMKFSWNQVDQAVAPWLNERCSSMPKPPKIALPPTCVVQSGAMAHCTQFGA